MSELKSSTAAVDALVVFPAVPVFGLSGLQSVLDYPLENLGPERFQRVCQALLAKEFPKARLLPLSGPDGGRDAFVTIPSKTRRRGGGLVVFQVKYARDPTSLADPRKWVLEAIAKELPKINELVELGAQHYRLVTNVRGSGHLKRGSVDRLDAALRQLPIPADGWWRDDLLGRLDSAWDIKWSFPELFTGPDLLRAMIESGLTEDRARRSSAISTFLADQYDADSHVKFKQVELENHLLDLYVDVEMANTPDHHRRDASGVGFVVVDSLVGAQESARLRSSEFYGDFHFSHRSVEGAATLLLTQTSREIPQCIVLEGAPGQGKSTVTQYLCQVHRMRLLNNAVDMERVADEHLMGPLRLPFRVDLRDLAAWFHGRNPFSGTQDTSLNPQRSLETFFAAQIENASGGAQFSVADFHAIARVSSLLLVFDGLDEVADIDERRRVVKDVSAALRRIRQIAPSLQVLVTSRPAAFENSPGFTKDTFTYYKLVDLSSEMISRYASKWIKARRLRQREAGDVRAVLSEKLDQPHMKDLARNPMQLAILLSLIHRRGPSLPDKRTALYDSYINTFFDREAEKTEEVQRHRDLLVEIHQYLAWRLQAEVEIGNSQGTITEYALRELLKQYLEDEEKDPALVSVLFKSLVERVVAIVSRVQGTYEFEVRPLQEYFAARFLYDTAQYSPPGSERSGDKTDRFDALARNFYWLNVTRFYAGCYSKGELPSLADRLQVLDDESNFGETNHPRTLAGMLLSDWVFAQHPRSVKGAMRVLLRGFGTLGISQVERDPMALPEGSGRGELASLCWQLAESTLKPDRGPRVISTLVENCSVAEIDDGWQKRIDATHSARRTQWVQYGVWMGALNRASEDVVADLMDDPTCDSLRLSLIASSTHEDLVEAEPIRLKKYIDGLLDGEIAIPHEAHVRNPTTRIGALRFLLSVLPRVPSPDCWPPQIVTSSSVVESQEIMLCKSFLDAALALDGSRPGPWLTSLRPWNMIVEAIRATWGDRWLGSELAIAAAGIRAGGERGRIGDDLFDLNTPLCERARYARLRAGSGKWWKTQLFTARSDLDRLFILASFFTWAGQATIDSQISEFDDQVLRASLHERTLVRRAIERSAWLGFGGQSVGSPLDISAIPCSVSPETAVLLMARSSHGDMTALRERFLDNYTGDDPQVLKTLATISLNGAIRRITSWEKALPAIKRAYEVGSVAATPNTGIWHWADFGDSGMSHSLARDIVEDAASYPLNIVALAEAACRAKVGAAVVPLAQIAEDQGW